MITSTKTRERILKAMERGAKLIIHRYSDYEGGSFVTGYTLEKEGNVLHLNNPVEYPPYAKDPISARCDVAQEIIKSDQVREGYIFNGEYGREYRQMFEHITTPVPRWVKEQWGFDDNGNLINPDAPAFERRRRL